MPDTVAAGVCTSVPDTVAAGTCTSVPDTVAAGMCKSVPDTVAAGTCTSVPDTMAAGMCTRLLHPQHLGGIWSSLMPYRLPFDTLSKYLEPWLQQTRGSLS